MPYQVSKEPCFFWGRKHPPSLFSAWQGHNAQKTRKISLENQVPVFLLFLSITAKSVWIVFPVAHVPSIRDTISFCILYPSLRIILIYIQSLFSTPQRKSFQHWWSKATFSWLIYQQLWKFHSRILKIANHYLAAMTEAIKSSWILIAAIWELH